MTSLEGYAGPPEAKAGAYSISSEAGRTSDQMRRPAIGKPGSLLERLRQRTQSANPPKSSWKKASARAKANYLLSISEDASFISHSPRP